MINTSNILRKIQKPSLCLIAILAAIYIYLYSLYFSFSNISMQLIYVILVVFVCLLEDDGILYVMFFMLPMRKLIYFGSFAFFNVVLIVYLVKSLMRRKSIPKIPFLIAVFLMFYDAIISMLSLPSYTVTAYMVKWYFGFFVFLYMLAQEPKKYDYRYGILFLNIGLLIVGLLTISQYMEYDVITGGLRERLAGAGGTMDQNTYSFHCLMGAISVLGFVLDPASDKRNKVFNGVIIFLGIFSMVCGMYMVSKGFYIVVAIILVIVSIKMITKLIRYLKYFVIGGVGIYFIIQMSSIQRLIASIMLRFSGATDASSLTTGRSDLYAYYIDAILSNPIKALSGAGLNTYRLVYNAHNNYITHNTTLELIAAWGLPLAVTIVFVIAHLYKNNILKNRDRNIFSLLPLIALLLFSQTVSMFWEDASLFYFVYTVYYAVRIRPNDLDYR